ncbi:M28 family peptidase [Baekduia sp. Peel2402]|uniref:M28 family peptidase n=1 Tax=Baekduia sp. Peel2402 TaxID=3458296 RepID=UPI00403EECC5
MIGEETKAVERTLRTVIEDLATLSRGAGSEGEREGARRLAGHLRAAGAHDVRVEDVSFRPGYAKVLLPLNAIAAVAGAVALRRGRAPGAAMAAALCGALIADDVGNGRRLWRRVATRPQATTNVVAVAGDPQAERTLVVLAHHDAAPTGLVFTQRPQQWIARRFPGLVEGADTSAPLWWPIIGAPLLIALGALTGRRGITRAGLGALATTGALGADIARDRIVPGANDNLSGCAALVALAQRRDLPVRVLLASCGAEEVLQGGIYAFAHDHLRSLDPSRTWVLNLDTIGSPELIMLEGEGTLLRVHDYPDPGFRDLIAVAAQRTSGELRRGCRARSSTDGVVTSKAGFPTATLCSWDPVTKCLTDYHLPTDTPDRLHYATIERAVEIAAAVAQDLAADPG